MSFDSSQGPLELPPLEGYGERAPVDDHLDELLASGQTRPGEEAIPQPGQPVMPEPRTPRFRDRLIQGLGAVVSGDGTRGLAEPEREAVKRFLGRSQPAAEPVPFDAAPPVQPFVAMERPEWVDQLIAWGPRDESEEGEELSDAEYAAEQARIRRELGASVRAMLDEEHALQAVDQAALSDPSLLAGIVEVTPGEVFMAIVMLPATNDSPAKAYTISNSSKEAVARSVRVSLDNTPGAQLVIPHGRS